MPRASSEHFFFGGGCVYSVYIKIHNREARWREKKNVNIKIDSTEVQEEHEKRKNTIKIHSKHFFLQLDE